MDDFLRHQLEHEKNTVEAVSISGGRVILAIKTGEVTQAQAILDITQTNILIDRLAEAVVRENDDP